MKTDLPKCIKCTHYFITHDPARPYGCRAMAFKSKINPARLVYETSGIICQLYVPKKTANNGSGSGSKKMA